MGQILQAYMYMYIVAMFSLQFDISPCGEKPVARGRMATEAKHSHDTSTCRALSLAYFMVHEWQILFVLSASR